jgi:hypothetical protein
MRAHASRQRPERERTEQGRNLRMPKTPRDHTRDTRIQFGTPQLNR